MRKGIDRFDLRILSTLQRNGRMTILKLAEQVGLSPSPCHTRVGRLEEQGIVAGYRAEVNIDKLTHTLTVIVPLELKDHEARRFSLFERVIADVPEVVECVAVGGGFDYILRVVTKDVESYQKLMDNLLERDVGISRYYSYFVTKPVKRFVGYPLAELLAME